MDTIQTVTLIGAVVAAATGIVGSALALLNYKRSGQRDELAWRRSSLVLALTTFLDSSFAILSDEALKARQDGDADRIRRARQRSIAKHTELVKAQTSLRLLADAAVVELAMQVHELIDEGYDAVFHRADPISFEELAAIKRTLRQCRSDLFDACRANLGLDHAVPIAPPTTTKGPSSLDLEENERTRTPELVEELVVALNRHGYLRRGWRRAD